MRNRYYDNVNQTLIWIFIVDDKVNDSNKVIKGFVSRHCQDCHMHNCMIIFQKLLQLAVITTTGI